jgi:hypothetical protein
MPSPATERRVLLAPDRVARAAARYAPDAEAAWMLRQPRAVRRSFAEQAFGRGELVERAWMLRQSAVVREAYVREVLGQ